MAPSIIGGILLSTSAGMKSSSQILLFILSISLCTSLQVSGENFISSDTCSLVDGLNSSIPVNLSHMFLIFSRKNVANSSANLTSVWPSGIGLLDLLLVRLFTRLNRFLVSLLESLIFCNSVCFYDKSVAYCICSFPLCMLPLMIFFTLSPCFFSVFDYCLLLFYELVPWMFLSVTAFDSRQWCCLV